MKLAQHQCHIERMFVLLGSEWPMGILYRPHTCVLAGQQRQDVESKLA